MKAFARQYKFFFGRRKKSENKRSVEQARKREGGGEGRGCDAVNNCLFQLHAGPEGAAAAAAPMCRGVEKKTQLPKSPCSFLDLAVRTLLGIEEEEQKKKIFLLLLKHFV